MTRLHYSPLSLLQDLQWDWNRMAANPQAANGSVWVPAVDVSEDEQAYFIAMDLPGVSAKDVEITAHDGVLTISGKRELDSAHRQETSHERWRGEFRRRFTLPEHADVDHIEAKYDNGVLAVRMPKAEAATPKRIVIQ